LESSSRRLSITSGFWNFYSDDAANLDSSKPLRHNEPGYVLTKKRTNGVRKPRSGCGSANANLPNGNSRR
jgi:hypothetical protein